MRILSIETSCDETALAIIDGTVEKNGPVFKLINNQLYSQIDTHKQYGGVFPAVAKREHAKKLVPLLENLLQSDQISFSEYVLSKETKEEVKNILSREPGLYEALIDSVDRIKKPNIDMIAVTVGPGLEPALWVGINFAKALSLIWNIPVIPVNHMEGHIVSVLKEAEDINKNQTDLVFPAISLLISGGHTEIVLVKNWGEYEILGATKDDAVGEAFDKTARLLGLPYPGGKEISVLAKIARDKKTDTIDITLPRPMLKTDDFNFSFSGLKTAVLYLIKRLEKENKLDTEMKNKICLEFETAATEVLFAKTTRAIEKFKAKSLIIGGGVSANEYIRETFNKLTDKGIKVFIPIKDLSTDNAIMIGIAGLLKQERVKPEINPELVALGNLKLS